MVQFDFTTIAPRDRYKLLVSTVLPRPIAWVVTQSQAGLVNAAPFSFFNALGGDPPLLMISVEGRADGTPKDTAVNIAATGQFVVNLVAEHTVHDMTVTAIEFDPSVSEPLEGGIATVPSVRIAPPRLAVSPVAFECEHFQTIELPGARRVVLGQVVMMHVAEAAVMDAERCYIDTPKLELVGRMHGRGWYARTTDRFEVPRIPVEQWKRAAE